MKLSIPYFKQTTDYTCGPAAVRMLLAHHGKDCTEEELSVEAKTCSRNGTDNDLLAQAITRCGFAYHTFEEMTLDALRALVREGKPVLVNYRNLKNKNGHYAVVVGADAEHIVVQDPKYGEELYIPDNTFREHWVSGDEKYTRWGLVIDAE